MVFEATYLVAVLTAGQKSLCCGQYPAQMSKVLRPNNLNLRIRSLKNYEKRLAGAKNGVNKEFHFQTWRRFSSE
jgi:hypothetical protein